MTDDKPRSVLTTRIDIPASEELNDKLIALAVVMGKAKSELARELLTVQVEGMCVLMQGRLTWFGLPSDGAR